MQGHGYVQTGLAAEGGQYSVRLFPLNHCGADLGRDGFDIGTVGHFRVGHDRGRVAVDEHDPIPLFFERFTGLRARVVELARLPDDDGSRSDEQDGL